MIALDMIEAVQRKVSTQHLMLRTLWFVRIHLATITNETGKARRQGTNTSTSMNDVVTATYDLGQQGERVCSELTVQVQRLANNAVELVKLQGTMVGAALLHRIVTLPRKQVSALSRLCSAELWHRWVARGSRLGACGWWWWWRRRRWRWWRWRWRWRALNGSR